jgi:hypothetical protein
MVGLAVQRLLLLVTPAEPKNGDQPGARQTKWPRPIADRIRPSCRRDRERLLGGPVGKFGVSGPRWAAVVGSHNGTHPMTELIQRGTNAPPLG